MADLWQGEQSLEQIVNGAQQQFLDIFNRASIAADQGNGAESERLYSQAEAMKQEFRGFLENQRLDTTPQSEFLDWIFDVSPPEKEEPEKEEPEKKKAKKKEPMPELPESIMKRRERDEKELKARQRKRFARNPPGPETSYGGPDQSVNFLDESAGARYRPFSVRVSMPATRFEPPEYQDLPRPGPPGPNYLTLRPEMLETVRKTGRFPIELLRQKE